MITLSDGNNILNVDAGEFGLISIETWEALIGSNLLLNSSEFELASQIELTLADEAGYNFICDWFLKNGFIMELRGNMIQGFVRVNGLITTGEGLSARLTRLNNLEIMEAFGNQQL